MTETERAILVGLYRSSSRRSVGEESLQELRELAHSAGAQVVKHFIQGRARPDPARLLGTGKLQEIGESVTVHDADLVIVDEDLTPAQQRNLEESLQTKVVDRSKLILDIFAQRARSREGKLQVELAQLEYLLPRLMGRGVALSRLGGGIGTRGPGETKLEVDRRTIREKISRIRRELEKLEKRRSLHRLNRKRMAIPVISLTGYTNAGKSTLFNRLAQEETYVSPRMFATLDPLVRKITLAGGRDVLLSDTVGFIRRLPHSLVAAFHATLEETLEADLILHVIDVSRENYQELRSSVYAVLEEIGLKDKPILEVYNKIDLLGGVPRVDALSEHVFASAETGEGLPDVLDQLESMMACDHESVDLTIPFHRGDLLAALRERVRVQSEEYGQDGIHLRALLSSVERGRYREFVSPSRDVSSRHHRKAKRW